MKIRRVILSGIFSAVALTTFCQGVAPEFTASAKETERIMLVKNNIPLTDESESSFWPQYENYRDEIRFVSLKANISVQNLAESTKTTEEDEALGLGLDMLRFRQEELNMLRKHYTEIGLLNNGVTALKFLQTETVLGMIEDLKVYDQSDRYQNIFSKEIAEQSRQDMISDALALTPEEAAVFLPVYSRYEKESAELLGEHYNMYSLFASEATNYSPAVAQRQGQALLELMERETRVKGKYFNEINTIAGTVLAARFLAWEDYYSIGCKLSVWSESR